MLDVGWSELLVIGALALIVVGPKDLPQLLRQVGKWVGQIKRMGREFQRSLEDAAREADVTGFKELRDLKKDMGSLDFGKQASKAQDYLKQPVKPEAAKASAAKAAADAVQPDGETKPDAAKADAAPAADPAAEPETAPPAPVEPEERRPPAARVSEG